MLCQLTKRHNESVTGKIFSSKYVFMQIINFMLTKALNLIALNSSKA